MFMHCSATSMSEDSFYYIKAVGRHGSTLDHYPQTKEAGVPDPLLHERVPASAFLLSAAAASTPLLKNLPGRGQTIRP